MLPLTDITGDTLSPLEVLTYVGLLLVVLVMWIPVLVPHKPLQPRKKGTSREVRVFCGLLWLASATTLVGFLLHNPPVHWLGVVIALVAFIFGRVRYKRWGPK